MHGYGCVLVSVRRVVLRSVEVVPPEVPNRARARCQRLFQPSGFYLKQIPFSLNHIRRGESSWRTRRARSSRAAHRWLPTGYRQCGRSPCASMAWRIPSALGAEWLSMIKTSRGWTVGPSISFTQALNTAPYRAVHPKGLDHPRLTQRGHEGGRLPVARTAPP